VDTLQLVGWLKVDLGITTAAYDERLAVYVESARAEIIRQGATLDDDSISDAQLVVMYAAWLWRRRDTGDGMPRMLRYALNNRVFSEKMSNG
jgi:hypothetical protein